ncbi:hypothetical protein BTURTLESOX_273 [bacterium endosymbiont of Bathymodiolus sp. 5 South]|nr:hypothetical protein BTURTLESOX_273 [bacterium endosymbiont of Bathymodiolus sp. 5 South]
MACQDSLFCNFGLDNKKMTTIEMITNKELKNILVAMVYF